MQYFGRETTRRNFFQTLEARAKESSVRKIPSCVQGSPPEKDTLSQERVILDAQSVRKECVYIINTLTVQYNIESM